MGLKKGSTNNPNGRPKGSPNKTTGPMRNRISDFLSANFDTIMHDLKSLSQKDRVKAYTDMLQYGLPKLQAVALKAEIDEPERKQKDLRISNSSNTINISELPADLRKQLIDFMKVEAKTEIYISDEIDYSKLSTQTLEELLSYRH